MVLAIPLSALIVAVALLLLYYASRYLLVAPLTWLVQQLPLPAALAIGAVERVGSTAVGWAKSWLDSAAGPLLSLVSGVVTNAYTLLSSIVLSIEWLAAHATSVAVSIALFPLHLQAAQQTAEQYVDQAVAQAREEAAQATAHARAVAQAADDVAREHAAAYTRAEVARAERFARSEVATAMHAVDVAKAEEATARTAAIHTLEGTFATDLGAVRTEIGDLSGVVAGLGVASLAAALVKVEAQVAEIPLDCIGNLCGSSSPLQGLLKTLLTDAELALVIAFVAEAIRDPKGTAGLVNDARGVMVPLVVGLAAPFGVPGT